jgi:hypothetical protein
MTYRATAVWKTGNCTNSESVVTALTGSITERRKTNMRTKITFYGEIAGNIWMPAVECTKAFHLEPTRIPRASSTRTYPCGRNECERTCREEK